MLHIQIHENSYLGGLLHVTPPQSATYHISCSDPRGRPGPGQRPHVEPHHGDDEEATGAAETTGDHAQDAGHHTLLRQAEPLGRGWNVGL